MAKPEPRGTPSLEKAWEVRRQRGKLRKAIKAGEVDPWRLLRGSEPAWEPWVRSWRLGGVGGFLMALPGVGEVTMMEVLVSYKLDPNLTPAGMTYELRAALADALSGALSGEPVPPPAGPAP